MYCYTAGFLSLPPEIRNAIYALALLPADRRISDRHSRTQWPVWPFYHRDAPARRPRASRLALLATCRAIHAEASPVFYGNVTFELVDPRSPRWTLPWLRTIGANAAAVRFLAVHARERPGYWGDDSALGPLPSYRTARPHVAVYTRGRAVYRDDSGRWTEAWAAAAEACPNVEVLELRRTTASDGSWALDDERPCRLGGLLSGLRGVWPRLRVVRLLDLPPGQDEMLRGVCRRVGCGVQAAGWKDGVLEVELEVEVDGEDEEPKRWAHHVAIRHLLRPIRPY